MSSVYLPAEILDQIFAHVAQECELKNSPYERDKNYSSFVLVSKSWSGVASRHVFKSLKIRDGNHIDQVIYGMSKNGLGAVVLDLEIVFQEKFYDEDNRSKANAPSLARIQSKDMISYTKFITLVKLLPSLVSLKLVRPTFIRFRQLDLKDSTIFPKLTSILIREEEYHHDHIIIHELFKMSTTIENLSFFSNNFSNPAGISAPLQSLFLCSYDKIDYSIFLKNSFFLTSINFIGMRKLEIFGTFQRYEDDSLMDMLKVLSIAGKTLEVFRTTLKIPKDDIVTVLSLLPRLLILRLGTFYSWSLRPSITNEIINHLPTSLHTLEDISFGSSTLAYLKQLPEKSRPNLIHLVLSEISADSLRSLPQTIQTLEVRIESLSRISTVLKEHGKSITPDSLTTLFVVNLKSLLQYHSMQAKGTLKKYGLSTKNSPKFQYQNDEYF